MTKTRAQFEDDLASMRVKHEAAIQRATEAFTRSAAVIVTEHKRDPELYILSGNVGGGKDTHRITFFMKDGPRGHHEGSVPELMDYIAGELTTYQPVADAEVIAWTSTPEFEVGSRRVAYIQALNQLSYLRSQIDNHDDKAVILDAMSKAQSMEDVEKATAFMQRVLHAMTPMRRNPAGRSPTTRPLEHAVKEMLERGGHDGEFSVEWWSHAEEKRSGKRDFAMVDPSSARFLFSQRVMSLDEAHREALIAHEVGHVLAFAHWGDDGEKAADRAAAEFLGVDIQYDKAFPGKGLQVCALRSNPSRIREDDFDLIPNPTPWVTSVLSAHFTELEDTVPPEWLPKISKTKAVGTTFTGELAEFGCGAFGCVLPTLDPSVVLKVTADESEAEFAAKLARKLPTHLCTAYHMVVFLKGDTRGPRNGVRSDGRGQPIYLLWRESADDVGKIDKIVGAHAEAAIHRQHTAAMDAFLALERGRDASQKLEVWKRACADMGKIPELHFVSVGLLRAFDEAGVFISDTHGGNLGVCQRNGEPTWVITDPGNVVVM